MDVKTTGRYAHVTDGEVTGALHCLSQSRKKSHETPTPPNSSRLNKLKPLAKGRRWQDVVETEGWEFKPLRGAPAANYPIDGAARAKAGRRLRRLLARASPQSRRLSPATPRSRQSGRRPRAGSARRACPHPPASARSFASPASAARSAASSVPASTASTLDSATISALLAEAVAVGREFAPDRAVGGAGVLPVASTRCSSAPQRSTWPRKRSPRPWPSCAPSIRPGMSASTKSRSSTVDDAEAGMQRGERIVGDLRLGGGDGGEEGRLAGVGQADEADVGDQLQAQPRCVRSIPPGRDWRGAARGWSRS